MTSEPLPGGKIAHRPVRFFFLVDCSGSMRIEGKMQSLNQAIREAIPAMREVAKKNPTAQLQVQVIKFADVEAWHVASPTPIESFQWQDIEAHEQQRTAMGAALRLVAEQLHMPPMPERALSPILCLVSDGQPTDDFRGGLQALQGAPWNKKAVRIGIGIGKDADLDVLRRFVDNPEIPVLIAQNSDQLADYIRWASTIMTQSIMAPPSVPTGKQGANNVQVPKPPPPAAGPIEPW